MNAAKDDVAAVSVCGLLRKLVGIASEVGEADDFIALVMMTEDDYVASELLSGSVDAFVHGVIG
jgi:hypothetical protein